MLHWRLLAYFLFVAATVGTFRQPLEITVHLAVQESRHTHILFVPLVVASLMALMRCRIFESCRFDPWCGAVFLLPGVVAYALGTAWGFLTLRVAAIVLIWIGGYGVLFGRTSLRSARFPFCLLLLFAPMPSGFLSAAEGYLQRSSADVSEVLFRAIGTPLFRDGLLFSIPGVIIEVAEECSGIRSTIALEIVALILGYLFLRSNWSRGIFALAAIPISIVKNAIRIVSLSWLGTHVSMDFLTGALHRRGGPLFALLSFALLAVLLLILQRLEKRWISAERSETQRISSAPRAS